MVSELSNEVKTKITSIKKGLEQKGLKSDKDFGFGYRPENGELLIYFNLENNGSFHSIVEDSSNVRYRPSISK